MSRVLKGATIVLPDRLVPDGAIGIAHDLIDSLGSHAVRGAADVTLDPRWLVVPGFVDVHVHGSLGDDVLDPGAPVAALARHLTRYGVTAFCPTTVACEPEALRRTLEAVAAARRAPDTRAARVLPAHLESNFIAPDFRGAQPLACLRRPPASSGGDAEGGTFTGSDIRDEIARHAAEVAIVTLAPELDGAIALIDDLVACGHRVSLGHSAADYDAAKAGIQAGATHATHLFNRMPPLTHRAPGLIGAVLESDAVATELIFDGHHVHPAVAYAGLRAKGAERVMAITDASAVAGLPLGSTAMLGGFRITAHDDVARLDDGTIAGSVLTMDRAFRMLVQTMGVSVLDAVKVCSTTPARELGLDQQGAIEVGAFADLTVLDEHLEVVMTLVGGHVAYTRQ